MLFAELIGIFIVALIIAYTYYKYVLFNYWRKRNIFYIKPVVPTGNIGSIVTKKRTIGEFFHDVYMKYKEHRAFGIYVFFKPNLIITDPDLIRIVLTKEFKNFHDRGVFCNEKIDPLTGHLFALSGQKWRNLRVKLTPTFTSGKMKQMFAIMKMCGDEFVKNLENVAQTGDSIEIKDWFGRYTTDIIMSTAFGVKSNCIAKEDSEFRYWGKKIFEIHPFWVALFFLMPQILNFFSIPLHKRSIREFFMKTFRENVEYRQSHNIIKQDFMNLLIQLMEKGYVESDDIKDIDKSSTINRLTVSEAVAQAFVFFAAGFETSSTTATFCLYELAQHQHLQDKLRNEIDEILKNHGELTYNVVNEMTYLHKVINETLRKYPPIPTLHRICTEEIDLPTTNIHVSKDTSITIPVFGLHRDPLIYPDPDRFDPERFNEDKIAARHPYTYLPFGEGPRICIGSRFGYMQTKIGLVSLLSKFKFKLDPRTMIPLTYDPTNFVLAPKEGVYLTTKPR
ncbi:probable cytochrome P450 6a14 [Camponotus floridanus]|uniref:probable cytochrome P450 6a14 n=1 Tax=Camponotus floridanus TaxID=104421 RepID=UPI000DC69D5D|nr:probable cytochrome P450 6a14 [Camponotus floridanus]